jgi:hypothetical protein
MTTNIYRAAVLVSRIDDLESALLTATEDERTYAAERLCPEQVNHLIGRLEMLLGEVMRADDRNDGNLPFPGEEVEDHGEDDFRTEPRPRGLSLVKAASDEGRS